MVIAIFEPDAALCAHLTHRLRQLLGDNEILLRCASEAELLQAFSKCRVDMAFLQADVLKLRWTLLQEQLRQQQPWVRTVLMSHSDDYALEAIRTHVHDYLILPISDEKLRHAFTEMDPDCDR